MTSPKLLEAIAELEAQRAIIDDAILHMQKAYEALNGTPNAVEPEDVAPPKSRTARVALRGTRLGRPSFVNEAVDAVMKAGHPLHISEIVAYIKSVRGGNPARTSVEASLSREEARAKEANRPPRILKTGRSIWGMKSGLSIAS